MKKSDIATLTLIVAVVGVAVYFLLKLIIGDQVLQPVSVEDAKPISAEVTAPSANIFNDKAINPTVPITIEGGDQKPIGE
ncbi:MAG TPA: hypothetical protein PKD68_02810 [Candidatus Saccharibacteria bacterium]|nr:hypothetical protein [Candidatus Saccharibacteria bacterium]